MPDICSFLNSDDMADHLREIGYEFTAPEAAFIVHLSQGATLDEKVEAWIEIARTMPDCSMEGRTNMAPIPSFRQFLYEYVGLLRRDLDAFFKPDGCIFSYSYEETGHGWQDDGNLFSSAEGCLGYLKERWADDDDPSVTGFRLAKSKVDSPDGRRDDWLSLNRRMEVMGVDCLGEDESDLELKLQLDGMWFAFPAPFKRGDIVISARGGDPRPFVLSSLPTWGEQELLENGFRKGERIVDRADWRKERLLKNGDITDMCCCGYGLGEGHFSREFDVWNDAVLYTECMCDCYLDMGRFNGELDDSELWMEVVSAHIKGEVDFGETSNLLHYLAVDSEARQLRGVYDSRYPEEYFPDGVWKRIRREGRWGR